MAAPQDFGSGLLVGLQGAMAMSQQRKTNALKRDIYELDQDRLEENKRQFDIATEQWEKNYKISAAQEKRAQAKSDTETTYNANDELVGQWGNAGLINFGNGRVEVDVENTAALLDQGNPVATDLMLRAANNSPKPDGFTFTGFSRNDDGDYVLTGEYEDGRPGVATEDGSSDDDSKVTVLSPKALAGLMNVELGKVAASSNDLGEGLTQFSIMSGMVDADTAARNAEQQKLEAQVLNSVDSTGNIAASRALKSSLAEASPEERNQIIRETATSLGIPLPQSQPRGTLVDIGRPVPTGGREGALVNQGEFDDTVIQNLQSKAEKLEQRLASGEVTDSRAVRRIQEQINDLDVEIRSRTDGVNKRALEAVESDIADTAARLEKAAPARKGYWQAQLDGYNDTKRKLEESLGIRTPVMGTAEYQQLEQQVFTRLDKMTPAEVDAAVDNGELSFTPEQIQTIRTRAQEAGVEKVADLSKLPTREQLMFRAALASFATDQNTRDQFREEMSNLAETGTLSLSAEEAADDRINDRTLDVRIAELNRLTRSDALTSSKNAQARLDTAVDYATDVIGSTNSIFFGEDGTETNLNAETATAYSRTLFPKILAQARKADNERELEEYVRAMNTGVSLVAASYAAEEEGGGLFEFFASFARPDAEGNVSGTDFDLSRIEMVERNGKPLGFYYTDDRGERNDKIADASDIQKLDGNLYRVLVFAGRRNAREG